MLNGTEKSAKTAEQVKRAVEVVRKCNSGGALSNIHRNSKANTQITQEQKALIESEIAMRLAILSKKERAIFTRQHPRPEYPKVMLEKLFVEAKSRFDLSNNKHGNHVRVGGDKIKGEKYLDLYISYKSLNNWVVGLAWIQDTALSPLYIRVNTYQRGITLNPESHRKWDFPADNEDQAIEKFFKLLSEVCVCSARKNEL